MNLCKINVFKCIVNISSQDFGVYFRRKANFGVGSKAEQHGALEDSVGMPGEDLMESQSSVGWVGCCFWTLLVFIKLCWWLAELASLLGWLWWRWEVVFGKNAENHAAVRRAISR